MLVAVAQPGVAVRVDLAMDFPVALVKLVNVAVSDQPLLPPRVSEMVMSLSVPLMGAGASGEVMVPRLTLVALLFAFDVPSTGVVVPDPSVDPEVDVLLM